MNDKNKKFGFNFWRDIAIVISVNFSTVYFVKESLFASLSCCFIFTICLSMMIFSEYKSDK